MRGGIVTAGIAAAAILCAHRAGAEVRLNEDASGVLSVEVDSTPRGPWTPMGSVTSVILNPSGDLFGDGMPGWDSRGSRVLSAWIRPGSGILHRSLGTSPGWRPLNPIASPGAQGQPVVDDLTDGWGIVWQQAATGGSRVLVTGTTVDGQEAAPIVASGGVLVGTSPSGNNLHVITMDVSGTLWCTTVAFSFIPTQPIPITLQIVGRVRLGSGGTGGFGSPNQGQGQPQGQAIGHREQKVIETVDPRIHDVKRGDGTDVGVVTWWGEDGELHGVDLGAEGPVLPGIVVAARPGRGHADAALDALLSAVSTRP